MSKQIAQSGSHLSFEKSGSVFPKSLPENSSESRTIAVVDDDLLLNQALCDWLDLEGLNPVSLPSAESLLRVIQHSQKKGGNWTLRVNAEAELSCPLGGVILDVMLDGISGIDMAWMLRHSDSDLPIVLITACHAEDLVHFGALPQGVTLLRKPFDLDAIKSALSPAHP
ncbi:MAG: response regulator [Acidobacteria bacterium]|nr:response regulator [Acidobacteriota bacterium]